MTKARRVVHAHSNGSADGATGRGDRARREEILDQAATLFASAGYVGTSVKDVADACGILPGSLYHHFESKEAIVVELVRRYQRELEQIGEQALATLTDPAAGPVRRRILDLAAPLADCAVRHRAAMQLTSYEPHTGAGDELVAVMSNHPQLAQDAMTEMLRGAQARGELEPDLDVAVLSLELCEAMRHVGLGELHWDANPRQVAVALCHLLLDGCAVTPLDVQRLEASPAMVAAEASIRAWEQIGAPDLDGKAAALLSVARAEFARRGYEATTVRDIAAAAGIGTGSVYRFVGSKEALLESIMGSFDAALSESYDAVLAAPATAVEKLDALTWVNINALEQFYEEREIQRAWMRASPPVTSESGRSRQRRAEQIHALVAAGLARAELRPGLLGADAPSLDVLALCFRDLIWPAPVFSCIGARETLAHCRATLLCGAAGELSVGTTRQDPTCEAV